MIVKKLVGTIIQGMQGAAASQFADCFRKKNYNIMNR
jgi:hypothetical protein